MEKSLVASEIIFIIGGGPSAKGIDFQTLSQYGYLLAVNDSFKNARCDGVFSMDGRWMSHRQELMRNQGLDCFLSKKHFNKFIGIENKWNRCQLYRVETFQPGMSEGPGLYANNSGFGAMNLAYLAKPKQIYLFGMDLTNAEDGDEHWYGDYEWRLGRRKNTFFTRWIDDHQIAAKQFDAAGIYIANVSEISKIESYPKVHYDELRDNIARIRGVE